MVFQYHSSIRILNAEKITQNTNSSDLILWRCCYIQYWSCSLLSVILLLLCWPSWTSVDIFLLTALLLSAEISNTEEINSEREEKLEQWKQIFTLWFGWQLSKKRPPHRRLFKQNKFTGVRDWKIISGSWGNTEWGRGLFGDKKSHSSMGWEKEENLASSWTVAPSVGVICPLKKSWPFLSRVRPC